MTTVGVDAVASGAASAQEEQDETDRVADGLEK